MNCSSLHMHTTIFLGNKTNENAHSLGCIQISHTQFKGEKGKTVYFDIILLLTLKQPHHIEKQENGKKK